MGFTFDFWAQILLLNVGLLPWARVPWHTVIGCDLGHEIFGSTKITIEAEVSYRRPTWCSLETWGLWFIYSGQGIVPSDDVHSGMDTMLCM